jgi:hypothetical protein
MAETLISKRMLWTTVYVSEAVTRNGYKDRITPISWMTRRSASELQVIKRTSKYSVDILVENSYGYRKESYCFERVKFLANQKKLGNTERQ